MEKALRKSESIFARYYLNDAFNDVVFDFELRDDIKIGQDFTVVSIFFGQVCSLELTVPFINYLLHQIHKEETYSIIGGLTAR